MRRTPREKEPMLDHEVTAKMYLNSAQYLYSEYARLMGESFAWTWLDENGKLSYEITYFKKQEDAMVKFHEYKEAVKKYEKELARVPSRQN